MSIAVDEQTIEAFKQEYTPHSNTDGDDLDVHIFEWDKGIDGGVGKHHHYQKVNDIPILVKPQVRVV